MMTRHQGQRVGVLYLRLQGALARSLLYPRPHHLPRSSSPSHWSAFGFLRRKRGGRWRPLQRLSGRSRCHVLRCRQVQTREVAIAHRGHRGVKSGRSWLAGAAFSPALGRPRMWSSGYGDFADEPRPACQTEKTPTANARPSEPLLKSPSRMHGGDSESGGWAECSVFGWGLVARNERLTTLLGSMVRTFDIPLQFRSSMFNFRTFATLSTLQ